LIEVVGTEEFASWYATLDDGEAESVNVVVDLLEERGVRLRMPYSSEVKGSRHGHMRELRIQHQGRPLRVFYCFDPRRQAVLLLGGDKTGDDRFYERMLPQADRIYGEYLGAQAGEEHKR
jgi:hypothetical protein